MDLFSRRIGPYFSWIESKIESGWIQNDGKNSLLRKAKELSTNMRARFITGIDLIELKEEISIFEEFFNTALDKFPDYSDEIEIKLEHFYKGIRAEVGEEVLSKKQEPKLEIKPLKEKPKIIGLKPQVKVEPKQVEPKVEEIKEEPEIVEEKVETQETQRVSGHKNAQKSKDFLGTQKSKDFSRSKGFSSEPKIVKPKIVKKKIIKKKVVPKKIKRFSGPQMIKNQRFLGTQKSKISSESQSDFLGKPKIEEPKPIKETKPKKKKGNFFIRAIKNMIFGEEE